MKQKPNLIRIIRVEESQNLPLQLFGQAFSTLGDVGRARLPDFGSLRRGNSHLQRDLDSPRVRCTSRTV